jgi:hypothetical protein
MIMDRCPLCRAMLHGADACRRCRAKLGTAQRVERDSQALVGAAIYHLVHDNAVTATHMLRRALVLHATPEARALWRLTTATSQRSNRDAEEA